MIVERVLVISDENRASPLQGNTQIQRQIMDGIRYFMYALWTFWEKHGCIGCVYYKHYGSCNHQHSLLLLFFYKKKLATGEGLKIQYNTKSVIYLIIAISAIVFIIWTLFWGSIQIRCNDRDFNIEAKGWNDYTGSIRKLIAFLMKKMYCRTIMITELMVLEN